MRELASLVFAAAFLAGAAPALAADDDKDVCIQAYAGRDGSDDKLAACRRFIDSKAGTPTELATAHLWQGINLGNKGRRDAAIAEFGEAIKLDPMLWQPWSERGELKFWWKKDIDGGLADLDEAVKRSPSDYEVYRYRADIKRYKGDYDGAIADFSTALSHPNANQFGLLGRGFAKLVKRDYDGAIADFTKGAAAKPGWLNLALGRRCDAYTRKGNVAAAIADCNEAIRLQPRTPSSYASRGYAYMAQGDLDKAIEDFNVAIEKNANAVRFYAGRGEAYERKKDFDNARADYQIAASKNKPWATAEEREIEQNARERLAALPSAAAPPAPPQKQGAAPITRRIALVVGNGAYTSVPALPNPPKDANAVAKTLEDTGFKVTQLANDLTRDGFLKALRAFSIDAAKSDWAVVYYAGHGMEVGGVNYLIPVDAKLEQDSDAERETVSLELVIASVAGAKKMRLVMLDACRDNPFAAHMRHTIGLQLVNKGLSNIEPDSGTMVVYATRHGQTAMDGEGAHSPFATAVIQDLPRPGIEVRRLFDIVRDDVMTTTKREQQPFSYGSLPGSEEFYFVAPKG